MPKTSPLYEAFFRGQVRSRRVRACDLSQLTPLHSEHPTYNCLSLAGLAPSTESLLHRWASRRAAYAEASGPADVGTVAEDKGRKWAHRWRLRFRGKIGVLRLRDQLPLGEARAKAGHDTRAQKTRPKMDSDSELYLGLPRPAVTIGKPHGAHIASPFLGSESEPKNGLGKWSG